MGMGQTMLFAILPPAARSLALSEIETGLIITASAFFFMIFAPIWGRLADKWGRRPVFTFGLACYVITTFGFTLVLDAGYRGVLAGTTLLGALVAARVAFGMSTGGIQTGATAMMADATSALGRTAGMALVGASFGFGAVLGPALVSLLAPFGILHPLYAVAVIAFSMGIFARVMLPETAHAQIVTRVTLSPRDPRILPVLLLSFVTYLTISMHNQCFGFYVQDLLQTEAQETARNVGFCYIALGIAMIFAQGVLVQVFKPPAQLLLRAGAAVGMAGYAMLLLSDALPGLLAAMAIIGFGAGLLQAGIMSAGSLRVTPQEQGAAAGLLSAAPAAGFLFGPSLSATLYTVSHSYPFAANALLIGIAGLAAWRLRIRPVETPG